MIKTIDNAFDYLYSFINLEKNNLNIKKVKKKYSLDNINSIIKYFDLPDFNNKIFHIAGTKGKGSVSYIIAVLLKNLGFNTTNFLSPHLIKPNERFLYNLNEIIDNEIIDIVNNIFKIQKRYNFIPTTFELFFILFLLYSKIKNPDYIIIETGLGGRLDCTNICNPLVSIITSVSYDHMEVLGKTLKKIAYEKAGIIKYNVPVVSSNQNYKVKRVINKKCAEMKTNVFFINKNFKILNYKPLENGIKFSFKFNDYIFKDIYIKLLGKHQIYNFFTALQSVYLIKPDIINKLKNKKILLKIPGRIEIINKDFPIIIDVAHNQDSAEKLKNTILTHFPGKKWNILSGIAIDKDYKHFYNELKSIADSFIITTISSFKKSDPDKIFKYIKKINKKSILIYDFKKAVNKIISMKKPIIVTGSFYITGPFIEYYNFIMLNNDKYKLL